MTATLTKWYADKGRHEIFAGGRKVELADKNHKLVLNQVDVDRGRQHDLDEVTVWDAGCHQYYRVPSGRIVTQWPHSMFTYQEWTEAPDPDDAYEVGARGGS